MRPSMVTGSILPLLLPSLPFLPRFLTRFFFSLSPTSTLPPPPHPSPTPAPHLPLLPFFKMSFALSQFLPLPLPSPACPSSLNSRFLTPCLSFSSFAPPPPPPPTFNNNNNRIQRRYSRFFTISSQRRELSPTRTLKWPRRTRVQITCNTSSAYHVQVSCYVSAQLLSLTELKSIYLSFILLAEQLNR